MLNRSISAGEEITFVGSMINGNIGDRAVVNASNLTQINSTLGKNVTINCNGESKSSVSFSCDIGKSSVINCGKREVTFFGPVEDDVSITCKGQPTFFGKVGKGVKINGVPYQHQPSPPVAAEDAIGPPDIAGPTFWNGAPVLGGVYTRPINVSGSISFPVHHRAPAQSMIKGAELKKPKEKSSRGPTTVYGGSFFAQPVVCLGDNNIIGGQVFDHGVSAGPAAESKRAEERSSKGPADESDKSGLSRVPGGSG